MASVAQVNLAHPPRSRRSHPDLGVLCPTTMTTTTTTTRTDPNQNLNLDAFESQMQGVVHTLSDLIREHKTTVPNVKESRDALAQAEGHLAGAAEHARNNRPTWTSCLFSKQGKIRERELKLRRFVASVRASFESLGGRCGRAEERLAGVRERAVALSAQVARGPWAAVCEIKARRLETERGASENEPSKAAVLRAHIAVKLSLTKLAELVKEVEDDEASLGVVREKCAFVVRRLGFVLEEEDLAGLIWGLKYAVEDVQAREGKSEKQLQEKTVISEKGRSRSTSEADTLSRGSFMMLRG
ncbi:hypothetical protein CkaCkLH20_04717 [Colletotrichum karsti]|uniref:Uncharacterized protein n=1 Tax=Colletotrichum karsti TaxID=1095194 RepID=A0A9P6I8C0_9PEZI|nr:uncharacterized protein CkaCkLH20_04717 [Colletotrichum karsti]KAF9877582.1 hypothetical protein CkaCkLH20_04717 [Colletotrichum karsti]